MVLRRGMVAEQPQRDTGAPSVLRHNPLLPPSSQRSVPEVSEWSAQTADGMVATRSVFSVSRRSDARLDGGVHVGRPIATGFDQFDYWTGNGLRPGELLLLGGAPGAGKTTLCLQMARNIASSGQANVLYACYEHPAEYVLDRLLVQQTIDPTSAGTSTGVTLDEFQSLLMEAVRRNPNESPYVTLRAHPVISQATIELDRFSSRFHLVANAARQNNLETLLVLVQEYRSQSADPLVLFVDYLQKIEPGRNDFRNEDERVTEVVQALKQLALQYNVAVVAIAAAEKMGIRAPRLRLSHLRGSSALMYEADIAIIMNDKWQIIDRDHIIFNQHKAQQFRDWVVCTIEKNRSGRNLVEIEFMKRFEYCCFNPIGGKVNERLYEERIQGES